MQARLRTEPLLPILGPSGAGKSSFVRAALVPRLREQGPLTVVELRPGRAPFEALAHRLVRATAQPSGPAARIDPEDTSDLGARAAPLAAALRASPHLLNVQLHRLAEARQSQVLLFVDQLEELVGLGAPPDEVEAFMQALCAACVDPALPVRVVFTLREEFLSRLTRSPAVQAALTRMVVLRAPGPDTLKEILQRSVAAVGYAWESPALVERMVAAVTDEAAALPLLQFAGQQLWDRRDPEREVLTEEAYRAIGGVTGALAHHADRLLADLPPPQVDLARRLLLRLVSAEGTRRTLARDQLLEGLPESAAGVLQRLVEGRLLTSRSGAEAQAPAEVELAHESLISKLERLARWIEESTDEIVFLAEVGQAASLWSKRGRRDEEVWTGRALSEALDAASRCSTGVPSDVQAFLHAGRRKASRQTTLRRATVGVVIAALAGVAIMLFTKERETAQQRNLAVAAEGRATEAARTAKYNLAESLAEKARRAPTGGEALIFAAGALRHAEHPDARGVLAGRLGQERPTLRWRTRRGPRCRDLALDAARGRLLCADDHRGLIGWRLDGSGELARTDPTGARSRTVWMAEHGRVLVTGDDLGFVSLRDPETLRVRRRIDTQTGGPGLVRGRRGDRNLTFVSETGAAARVHLEQGQVRTMRACARATAVAASADGRWFALACKDRRITLWHPEDGRSVTLRSSTVAVDTLALAPDARRVLVGAGRSLSVLDVAQDRLLERELAPAGGEVQALAWTAREGPVWVAHRDGRVRRLSPETLAPAGPELLHPAGAERLLASPGDGPLITWGPSCCACGTRPPADRPRRSPASRGASTTGYRSLATAGTCSTWGCRARACGAGRTGPRWGSSTCLRAPRSAPSRPTERTSSGSRGQRRARPGAGKVDLQTYSRPGCGAAAMTRRRGRSRGSTRTTRSSGAPTGAFA